MDSKTENILIILSFILVTACFTVFFTVFYMVYCKGVAEAYKSTPELSFLTILLSIRIVVMASFSFYMFKKWITQEKKYFKNIPFLVGLFFYFVIMGKIFDLLIYIYYSSPNFVENDFLFILKLRYLFMILNYLPLLFLGLRPVIYNIGLKRKWNERKVLTVRKIIITTYMGVFSFIIMILPTLALHFINLTILTFVTYISICFIFRFGYKNNTFPTIRANYISWGFLLYLISSALRMVFVIFFNAILTIGQQTIIVEISDFSIVMIIFFGFISKKK